MSLRIPLAAFLLALLLPGPVMAQEKNGAVLLQPESDMDRELADDLTEVLISAVIDKSGRAYRIEGKESFKKTLLDRKADDGNVCLASVECVRKVGTEMGLDLLVFGKVGKAMGGYRLEVWRLSTSGGPDPAPYRKRVTGDVGQLIVEVEALADWVLAPAVATLTVTTVPPEAAIQVDGKPGLGSGTAMEVSPGPHKVEVSMDGYTPQSVDVTCVQGQPCQANVTLVLVAKVPDKIPDRIPDKVPDDGDKGKGKPPLLSTGTIVASSVLAGVAVASGIGSFVFYKRMTQAETDILNYATESCPKNKCPMTVDEFNEGLDPITQRGENAALWANICGGVAIASAVGAATILVVDLATPPKAEPRKTVLAPVVAPDYSGFSFSITF
ncbi:MAG: PEGA domain-containing protein [Deltaproteobacteria bacterium]|nr:PEGA domain-containing protein [Deltaproteobacteria bacterium]